MKPSTVLEIIFSLAIFSTVATTLKFVHANPFTIGIVRLLIASIGMLMVVLKKHSWSQLRQYTKSDGKQLFLIGTLFFCHWVTYFFSIKLSSASLGILSLSTYGVFMGIIGSIVHHEPFYKRDLLASFVCVIGVFFLIPEFSFENKNTLGLLVGLISAFFYSLVPMVQKKLSHVPQNIRTFYQFFGALPFFLCTYPLSNWDLSRNDWLGLIYLGTAATLIAHTIWSKVCSEIPSKTSGLIYYTYIPLSVSLAVFVMGDELSPKVLLGAGFIFSGLLLGIAGKNLKKFNFKK